MSSALKTCFAKHTKNENTYWEKIFTNHISDKGLYSEYIKESARRKEITQLKIDKGFQ